MYCSSCGVAVTPGISYCNYCGAKLTRGDGSKASELRPETLVFGMLATFVFGIVAITVLMGVMKSVLGLEAERALAFATFPFLIMVVMEAVFIRVLTRRNRGKEERKPLSSQHATNELGPPPQRTLPEQRQSVTEHTTRAFDPIYTERKSN